MAKIPFSKLDAKINSEICTLSYHNSKNEEIFYDVKKYLPIQEKIDMISNIINQSVDDNDFYNPLRVQIFTALEIVYFYTNLSFTSKQKENPFKLYDLLISSGIFKNVVDCIYENDWTEIQNTIITVIENIYKYKNSARGIMEMISTDYSNLSLDAEKIQKTLAEPENMSLLKDVLTKLG